MHPVSDLIRLLNICGRGISSEARRLATSAAFTGNYKAKDQDYVQPTPRPKRSNRDTPTEDLRSVDVAWVPSETIFVRVDLPIAVPALAQSQLPDAVTSGNGFIPLERIQYGLAEVASDLMCLPQMIMTATGRRDIVSPVDVASGAIGPLPKDVRLFFRELGAPFRVVDRQMDVANMLGAQVSAPVVVIAACDYICVRRWGHSCSCRKLRAEGCGTVLYSALRKSCCSTGTLQDGMCVEKRSINSSKVGLRIRHWYGRR